MASKVSICNVALGWLGQSPISEISEASTTAQLCDANYEDARLAVLEEGVWAFAQQRFLLDTPLPDAPGRPPGLFYFGRPGNLVKVREMYKDPDCLQEVDGWTVEGPYIVMPQARAYGLGTVNVTDPNRMPASFRMALSARLAADLAIPITQSQTLQSDMWALYEDKLTRAAVIDASQSRRYALRSGGRLRHSRFNGRY